MGVVLSSRNTASSNLFPSDPSQLKKSVEECFLHKASPTKMPPASEPKGRVAGILAPHGPMSHAGPIAAHCYYYISGLKGIDTVILLGPVHKPSSAQKVSIYPKGSWSSPLGNMEIDDALAEQILNDCKLGERSATLFDSENCLDMHIPFLQFIFHNIKLVPILMQDQSVETSLTLGKAIGKIVKENKGALVIATSNLTHGMVYAQALRRDAMIFDLLPKPAFLDIKKIYSTVQEKQLSVCGYGPIMALITVVQQLGCRTGLNLKYGTSGETEGNYANVTGYTATVFQL